MDASIIIGLIVIIVLLKYYQYVNANSSANKKTKIKTKRKADKKVKKEKELFGFSQKQIIITIITFLVVVILVDLMIVPKEFNNWNTQNVKFEITAQINNPSQLDFEIPAADIYFIGASSLVWPSKEESFVAEVQKRIPTKRVANLGIPGIDSGELLEITKRALNNNPEMIVVYAGHNDFTNVYRNILDTKQDIFSKTKLEWIIEHTGIGKVLVNITRYQNWFAMDDFVIEPKYTVLMNRLGLAKINESKYQEINTAIAQEFNTKMISIENLAKRQGTKVVFVTPISNLKIKPYTTKKYSDLYNEAMNNKTISQKEKTEKLIEAKDGDLFSGDIRAKSVLIDTIRKRKRVIDLEKIVKETNIPTSFYDYVHLKPETHIIVGDIIANYLINNENVN